MLSDFFARRLWQAAISVFMSRTLRLKLRSRDSAWERLGRSMDESLARHCWISLFKRSACNSNISSFAVRASNSAFCSSREPTKALPNSVFPRVGLAAAEAEEDAGALGVGSFAGSSVVDGSPGSMVSCSPGSSMSISSGSTPP